MSTRGLSTSRPMSAPCFILSYSFEALISAFDGMQPTFRQIPPGWSRSTTSDFTPSWPSRMPATYPPGPAPMTRAWTWIDSAAIKATVTAPAPLLRDLFEIRGARRVRADVHRPHRVGRGVDLQHGHRRRARQLRAWRLALDGREQVERPVAG